MNRVCLFNTSPILTKYRPASAYESTGMQKKKIILSKPYLLTAYWFDTMNTKELSNQGVPVLTKMLVVTWKHPNKHLKMITNYWCQSIDPGFNVFQN
jgi:hypothetical protein